MIDPNDSSRSKNFNDSFTSEELLRKVFCEGKLVYKSPKITDIKMKLDKDLKMLDESHKRLENPHYYPIGLEESLFNIIIETINGQLTKCQKNMLNNFSIYKNNI